MHKLKSIFWEGTEHWDKLLSDRAEISGTLVLSDFTINAINSFKNDFSYMFDIELYLTKLTLEPPKELINGDMSTNMAMVLSKEIKLNPHQIAQNFVPYIAKIPGIEKVDVISADQMALDYKKSIQDAETQIENLFKD